MRYNSARYSRLQRLEEKRNVKRATLLTVGGVLIVILVLVIGIPMLVKLLLFLGDLQSANQPVDKNDLIPPGPPQLILPFDATNSATLIIKGTAEPGSTVFLTNNSDSMGNVVVADNGEFIFSGIHLFEGENELIAVAVDKAGNSSSQAKPANILYSSEVPELEISSPTDRQTITGNPARVNIIGKTDAGARLTVNNRLIIVDSTGNFNSTFNLNSGENILVIVATNNTGNQARKEMVVTYNP